MADLKSTFSKGLTTLNLKTSNFMEQNKIKTYIATLKQEISTLKFEIGEHLYQEWANGSASIESVEDKLKVIQEKLALIEAQEKEIEAMIAKEKQILGEIDQAVAQPNVQMAQTASSNKRFCTQCGTANDLDSNFCISCGNKMV